jgi:MobA/MobL family
MGYKHDRSVWGAGTAESGGSIHLSFRSGSRAGGASGKSAYDYISREGEYGGPDRDPATYTESDHMPSWAEDDPGDYWDAADLFERANGRLYVSADFALPRDLSDDDRIALAREFAHELTDKEQLPYTLAIHAGLDEDGRDHNPHAHLMFSERRNDGIERTREDWFRRANPTDPDHGGAFKSRTYHGPEWVEQARERWADLTNKKLQQRGLTERVDHRSYERQGIDREPGRHYGPSAPHAVGRGEAHDRLDDALAVRDDEKRLHDLDQEIARLEETRESIGRDGPPEDRQPEPRDYSHSHGGGSQAGDSWER